MHIERALRDALTRLQLVLSELSNEEYGRPLEVLSHASIGEHTRHIIEFFQTVVDNYDAGVFNYDKRKRNKSLETNRDLAHHALGVIMDNISRADKQVILTGAYSNETREEFTVVSTYYRELVYNLEHMVHHMAMIKIGIRESTRLLVPADFGVAPATIHHKRSEANVKL